MNAPRLLGIVLTTVTAFSGLAVSGCADAVVFQQTSGSSYSQMIPQALQLNEQEMAVVINAGGVVIGTIPAAKPGESEDQVSNTAGKVAGKHGGTHFVLSAAPLESFKPAGTVACPPGATGSDGKPCPTTDAPPTSAAAPVPVAEKGQEDPAGPPRYVVVRLEPSEWHTLPHELRPKRLQ